MQMWKGRLVAHAISRLGEGGAVKTWSRLVSSARPRSQRKWMLLSSLHSSISFTAIPQGRLLAKTSDMGDQTVFTGDQTVFTALAGLTRVQELYFFDIGEARYLAEPISKAFTVPGLDDMNTDLSVITIISTPPDPWEGYDWLKQDVERWLELDDVFRPEFLENVIIVGGDKQSSVDDDSLSSDMKKEWGTRQIKTLAKGDDIPDIQPGPHVLWKGELCKVYRLYDDLNLAFVVATVPQEGKSGFKNLRLSGEFYSALSVAVPPRISQHRKTRKPLAGLRFAVKDIFDIEGIRVTAGCRAYFDLSRTSSTTAPSVQVLIDQGANLVGTLKLGSLITREEPTESVDYHAAFNARGDGYQSAWSSSGGSGAALSAYDWLDFTLATDTTGSSRRPALANGIFQLRLSKDAVSLDGIVPSWTNFDSPALFGRNFSQFETIVQSWIGQTKQEMEDLPVTLLYPSDFWPVENEQQMSQVRDFLSDFQNTFGIEVQDISIAERWHVNTPKDAKGSSVQEYMDGVGVNSFCYGVYHELDWFRREYQSKFGKHPYVNPVMQWRWDAAQDVTEQQHDEAVHKIAVFREWFLKEILRDSKNTFVVLPITTQAVDYRDVPPPPPGPPNAFDGIWLAPMLGAPELSIPIGEMEYDSKISGNKEHLPIVVSVLSTPGSDMNLMAAVRKVLEHSKRPTCVRTGSRIFE